MSQAARRKAERFLSHLEPIQPALSAYCRRVLIGGNEVADVLQSAVVNAYRDFDLYAEGTNFRAWMFRYVSYEALNRNRAASRRRSAALPADLAAEVADAGWDESLMDRLLDDPEIVLDQCDDAIAQAVLELPDTERSIFVLRAVGEFKYREIAEILEIPMGTVMGLLSRSRDRLRCRLVEYARTHGLLPGRDSE
ncbi:MAG: RNA polymerase sigma factor [Planctomycetales bacterium]